MKRFAGNRLRVGKKYVSCESYLQQNNNDNIMSFTLLIPKRPIHILWMARYNIKIKTNSVVLFVTDHFNVNLLL